MGAVMSVIVKQNFSAGSRSEPFEGKIGETISVPSYVLESTLKSLVSAGIVEMLGEPKTEYVKPVASVEAPAREVFVAKKKKR